MKAYYNHISKIEVFEIHSTVHDEKNYGRNSRDFLMEKFQSVTSKISSKVDIEIYIWDKTQHDRYLLSNGFSISIPRGTDISNQKQTTWSIISTKQMEEISLDYHQNTSRYKLIDRFTIL